MPTASTTLVEMVRAGNVKEAMDRIERDQRDFPGWKICDEIGFNDAGYYLLYEKNDIAGAIAIFELNVREFPNSSNAYDSLAEAYLKAGKKELAIDNYKKSLLLDERNEHAKKILAEIAAN